MFVSQGWLGTNAGFRNALVTSDRAGNLVRLVAEPSAGFGIPYSVDVNRSFSTYREGTAAANSYRLASFPNPGGVPEKNNTQFSVTVGATGGQPFTSWLMLAGQPYDRVLLGLRVLVNPSPFLFLFPMVNVNTAQARTVLPIPPVASLCGATLFGQALLYETVSGRFATSDGVRFTIF